MRAISTLRLSEKERKLFLDALSYYGFENAADFLRAAARALIAAAVRKDQLREPIRFDTPRGWK